MVIHAPAAISGVQPSSYTASRDQEAGRNPLRLVAVLGIGVTVFLGWRSLDWPFTHDQAVMHYVAWLLSEGSVPYRDVFDMNLPGVYLVHLAFWKLFGTSDSAWRMFDLSWLGLIGVLIFRYCRPIADRWSAIAAAALFAVYHLSDGATHAGERDFLICAFLIAGAHLVARSWETKGALVPLWWGGLALGAAVALKPLPALFWIVCAVVAAVVAKQFGRSMSRAFAVVIGAGLIVPVLTVGWAARRGGLDAFVDMYGSYVIPLYGKTGRGSLSAAVSFAFYYLVPLIEFGLRASRVARFAAALGIITSGVFLVTVVVRERMTPRHTIAMVGLMYGVAHYFIQGKIWPYHMYPWVLFLCILVSTVLASSAAWRTSNSRLRVRSSLAWVLYIVVIGGLAIRGFNGTDGLTIGNDLAGTVEIRIVDRIMRDLDGWIPAGTTVQVLDEHNTALHALLNLRVRQPTRFIYDFQFFSFVTDPRIQALRAEFMSDLAANKPVAIVISPNYRRLNDFPEMTQLLARSYQLMTETSDYRIYRRNGV